MPPSAFSGMALTVTGPIDPAELGITLVHEHLLSDLGAVAQPPPEASLRGYAGRKVSIDILHYLRHHWDNRDDFALYDDEEAIAEAELFKRAGGRTIVDTTTLGIGRDPAGLARIARATGLNVVMAAGYYSSEVPQAGLEGKSEEQITAEVVRDIREGFGWPPVRAGIIGEIGCSWPMQPEERTVLRAAVAAQRETGAPLLVHPGRDPRAPIEIMGIVAAAGGDLRRTAIAHLDRTVFDDATLGELAATGCYLEYDLFGQESSEYPGAPIHMPNDATRVDRLLWLIEHGYGQQILVAHDIDSKWKRRRYGGFGLAHLVEDVVPIMRRKGITEHQVEMILVENPRRLLTFA